MASDPETRARHWTIRICADCGEPDHMSYEVIDGHSPSAVIEVEVVEVVADALPLEGHQLWEDEAAVARAMVELEGVPHMGCLCSWDEDGNPPLSCRCAERVVEDRRKLAVAVLRAALPGEHNTPETAGNADAGASGRASGAA